MFNKEFFLKDSRELFQSIFGKKKKELPPHIMREAYFPILDEVISYYNNHFSHREITEALNYDKDFLDNLYEIINDESEYDEDNCFKSYEDAFSYFSLNQCFIEHYASELEELFLNI